MNKAGNFSIVVTLCFLFSAAGHAQSKPLPCQSAKGLNRPASYPYDEYSAFEFSLGPSLYVVESTGRGTRTSKPGVKQHFRLKLDEGYITRLFVCELDKDLIIAVENDVGGYAGGLIYRVNGQNLDTLWLQNLTGFNVTAPVLDNGFAYVSGFGFVGSIDINTGKYKWRHDGLYNSGEFSEFEPAKLSGDVVLFREPHQPEYSAIAIQRNTGKIVGPLGLVERLKHKRTLSCGEYGATRQDCH